jgi:Gas vesicle protein G
MGLFTGLLTLPLAPVRGVGWIAEQLHEQAAQELYDEQRIMRELAQLELAHEEGEIDEEQLNEGTDALLARLEEGRRYREQREMYGE